MDELWNRVEHWATYSTQLSNCKDTCGNALCQAGDSALHHGSDLITMMINVFVSY